jgi:hypothetical protein
MTVDEQPRFVQNTDNKADKHLGLRARQMLLHNSSGGFLFDENVRSF